MITFKITLTEQPDGKVKIEMKPKGKNPTEAEKRVGGLVNRTMFSVVNDAGKSAPTPQN
jgi:hypothetical protein